MGSNPPQGQGSASGVEPSPLSRFTGALAVSPRAFQLPASRRAWAIPLLIVIVVQLASVFVLQDLVLKQASEQQAPARSQIENNPQMSAEQKEQAIARMEQFSSPAMIMTFATVLPAVGVVLFNLVLAAVLLLVLNFILGGDAKFGGLWFVGCLSWAPRAVESALFTLIARVSSRMDITFGPGAFFPADTAGRRFAGVVSIFDFWMIAVLIVGVQAVTGTARRKATGAVVGIWIVWWLVRLGLTAIGNSRTVKA